MVYEFFFGRWFVAFIRGFERIKHLLSFFCNYHQQAKFLSILQVYHPNLVKERETIVYNGKAERKLNYNQEQNSESHKNNKVSQSRINYKTKENTWESTFQTTYDTKARIGEGDNWRTIGICSAYNT